MAQANSQSASSPSVNPDLQQLQELNATIEEFAGQRAKKLEEIKDAFRNATVVFIDMVGSTQFKVEHADEPATWILRVHLFCKVVTEYVERFGGRVVKYIGDEVMAVFEGRSAVGFAEQLALQIDAIERDLETVIGVETRIKTAMDYGPVCFFEFDGHRENDPQGIPVDRCARLAKYASPGTVVASEHLARESSTHQWKSAGEVDLKGIGVTTVFQLGGSVSIDIRKRLEVIEDEWNDLCRVRNILEPVVSRMCRVISSATRFSGTTSIDTVKEPLFEIAERIMALQNAIRESPCENSHVYARFLYRRLKGDVVHKGCRILRFDPLRQFITEGILIPDYTRHRGYGRPLYRVNEDHPHNVTSVTCMYELLEGIEAYPREPYMSPVFSLYDPGFWHCHIGYRVD